MTDSPEAIRADIERTRETLGSDVDALADKVTPSKIVERQKNKVHSAVSGLRDRLMGAADDTAHGAADLAHGAADAVHGVAHDTKAKAKGNPLAVGLVAFGVGLVVASLIPPTRAERDAAAAAKDKAEPLVAGAKDLAHEIVDDLKDPASEAASALKDRASEAVEHVKDESASAASTVRDQAQESAQHVREG